MQRPPAGEDSPVFRSDEREYGPLKAACERAAEAAGSSVTWIGRALAPGEPVRLLDEAGRPRRLSGWDHLSRASAAGRSPEQA